MAGYTKWQPKCELAKELNVDSNKVTMYLTFGAPWPVTDRDLIIESTFTKSENKLLVKTTCKPNYSLEKEDFVRITYTEGLWEIEKKSDGKLFIRNTSHSNPGGNIPAWLSSSAVEDIPLELMQGFIKLLK